MNQLTSTQININFKISTDNDFALLALILGFWSVQKAVYRISQEVSMLAQDFREAFQITIKIFIIGFNSIKWSVLP